MMLQAVTHDVKNKLAELAMRLMETDIEAAALALDSADKLSQALLLDAPGELTPHIDSATPADLADELAAVHEQLFPGKKVTVDTSLAPTLWYYDVNLMRLALSNAVHNALKHCSREVNLRVCEDNGYLNFEVRDDGPGFDAANLRRDWERPIDPDATVRRKLGHNTGMGLLLAHKIVHAHIFEKDGQKRRGSMVLENHDGAVVRLTVP